MARKSEYRKIYSTRKLAEYLKTCEDTKEEEIVQENKEKNYKMYKTSLKVKLPTVEGYAEFLGFYRGTLYDWAKVVPEFSSALDKIKSLQKQKLIENGLQGTYNSTIAKLMLSSNHDMREKSDLTSDDKPLTTFTDEQINRIANRIARRSNGDANTSVAEESN